MAEVVVAALLDPARIRLDASAPDRFAAVAAVGELLVEAGAVRPEYVASMLERERSISTYVGEGVAIPHGTAAGKALVLADALAVVRFPDGVDWGDGNTVQVCIGIAATGEGHLPVLAALAELLLEPDRAAALRRADTADEVLRLLEPVPEPRAGAPGAQTTPGGVVVVADSAAIGSSSALPDRRLDHRVHPARVQEQALEETPE